MALSCFVDNETRAAMRVNRDIERNIEEWRIERNNEHKLLLLGDDEAMRMAVIILMHNIHRKEYTRKEMEVFPGIIYRNIVLAVQTLAKAMMKLEIQYEKEENRAARKVFMKIDTGSINSVADVSQNLQKKIKQFWNDGGVQICFEQRKEFQISDSTKYFMTELDRIFNEHYEPKLQDIIRVVSTTSGVKDYTFQIRKKIIFRVIDAGQQTMMMRKWLHMFEEVDAVIFITSINEYDQVVCGDNSWSRIEESIALFKTVISSPLFSETEFVLLLTNYDRFKEKTISSHLSDYFSAYKGPKGNHEKAAEFIKSMLMSAISEDPERRVTFHYTNPSDICYIEMIIENVRASVLERSLRINIVL